ncbi:MAG: hypothetical protein OEZ58_16620 [Gammaproteobacteria bacterium]|nr:hypothetical protein [Gammaproteobacteria bacterium]MDH5730616.1 hypothetical protein [Gammaproteobacteria bacterium]
MTSTPLKLTLFIMLIGSITSCNFGSPIKSLNHFSITVKSFLVSLFEKTPQQVIKKIDINSLLEERNLKQPKDNGFTISQIEENQYTISWNNADRNNFSKSTYETCRRSEARKLGEDYFKKAEGLLIDAKNNKLEDITFKYAATYITNTYLVPLVRAQKVKIDFRKSKNLLRPNIEINLTSICGYSISYKINEAMLENYFRAGYKNTYLWLSSTEPVNLNKVISTKNL